MEGAGVEDERVWRRGKGGRHNARKGVKYRCKLLEARDTKR